MRTQYVASATIIRSPRLTDSSPYDYAYAGETTGMVSHNPSYAGKAVCSILVFHAVRPCLLWENPVMGFCMSD